MSETGTILVVDDEELNRELLFELLEANGYRVRQASCGQEALDSVAEAHPDTILLDVMMPAPDGFEVCRRLKQDAHTAPIPIILVTALTDREARLRGIREGANDFITKPIDTAETTLRVRNAVRMKKLYDLSEERFQRQCELEKIKDSLVQMIVHDLKTPVSSITGYARFLESMVEQKLTEEERGYLRKSISNGDRLLEMIASVLDVTRMESGKMNLKLETLPMVELIDDTFTVIKPLSREGVVLSTDCEPALQVRCDRELIRRVLVNLADNALRHLPLRGGGISLSAKAGPEGVRVEVSDTGPGIPETAQRAIFEKFGQLDRGSKYTFGLGLTFCRMALEAHGGSIGVTSQVGEGSTFWLLLPD